MFGVGEEEVAATIAAAMLGGGLGGNDVARGNGTIGDDNDNNGDSATGDGATGYDDDNDGDG
jgi:hypothetical protein